LWTVSNNAEIKRKNKFANVRIVYKYFRSLILADRTLTYIPYMREKTVQERIIDSSDILIEDQYILEKEVEYIPICKHSVGSNIQY